MFTNTNKMPLVAIVGRPNVGKSTLFNRIIGWQKAIVEETPGVTRDRIYAVAEWSGVTFRIVDTGGFEPVSEDLYLSLIRNQVQKAVEEADLILFLLDAKTGLMPQDIEISKLLRKARKPVLYVVNKVDHEKQETNTMEMHALGIETFIPISSLHGRRINELLDVIVEKLPEAKYEAESQDESIIKVAVTGKPNVGKSTFVNRILGEERMLTCPIPGTTRDSIDTLIERDGKKYIFIDTAGIRKKSKVALPVERYSILRAIKTIERADIVLLMLDASEGPTHQDARLAELINERNKGCVILVNKWDLVPKEIAQKKGIQDIIRSKLKALDFAPVMLISALTGKRVIKVFDYIDLVHKNFSCRISTKSLNKLLENILRTNPPHLYKGAEIKFYYISQPLTKPPTFVIFTNSLKGVQESYKRYLENRLREEFELQGTAIKVIFRGRRKS
ncbi:MAG: small GTP-binding protein domain-containing protein, GTP-binding protein [Candidatus Dadabacteria bacterium CSP1-2]|nr:MAG: small GTP-binding protein domain-containing protein, GTP-binding protein [Candidatus Dadabacteria bacterium CSP1-2]